MKTVTDPFAPFQRSFQAAVTDGIERLGGQEFLKLPEQDRINRLRERVLDNSVCFERGFWQEALVKRTTLGKNQEQLNEFAALLHRIWKHLPGQAVESGGIDTSYFVTILSNNHSLRPLPRDARLVVLALLPKLAPAGSPSSSQCRQFLSDIMRATDHKSLFATGLEALLNRKGLSVADVIEHGPDDPERMARVRPVKVGVLQGVIQGETLPSLQALHCTMLGLENAGVSRSDIATFCRELKIPYDNRNGCVLLSMREILDSYVAQAKAGVKHFDHVQLLRKLTNARDVNQSGEKMAGYMHLPRPTFENLLNYQPAWAGGVVVTSQHAELLIRTFRHFAQQNHNPLREYDIDLLQSILTQAKATSLSGEPARWTHYANGAAFEGCDVFGAQWVKAEKQASILSTPRRRWSFQTPRP